MNKPCFLSIGEVSAATGVPPHTIRYWEKEFPEFIHTPRGNGRRRKFGDYELRLLTRIKSMLWEEKYSIAGARQKLRDILTGKGGETAQPENAAVELSGVGRT